jgi:hypothetical protein
MSIVTSSASRYWTFARRTAYVLVSTTAAASMTPTRSLLGQAYLQVSVTGGTTGSGTVQVTGTAPGGASQSETLTFSSNGTQVTAKRYATLASVATTGLANEATVPTGAVQAVSADGTPQLVQVEVAAERPVVVGWTGPMDYPAPAQGTHELDGAVVLVDYEEVWTPRVDDLATEPATGEVWLVRGVREVRVGFGVRPHHWQMRCTRYDT